MDLSKFSKLASVEIHPLTIRISDITQTELLNDMVTRLSDKPIGFIANIPIYEVEEGYYTNKWGAPDYVISVGYSSQENSILVDIDLEFELDNIEEKILAVYDWLKSDRFIKF